MLLRYLGKMFLGKLGTKQNVTRQNVTEPMKMFKGGGGGQIFV